MSGFSRWRFCAWVRWSVVVVRLGCPGRFPCWSVPSSFFTCSWSVILSRRPGSGSYFVFRVTFSSLFFRSRLQMRPTPVAARANANVLKGGTVFMLVASMYRRLSLTKRGRGIVGHSHVLWQVIYVHEKEERGMHHINRLVQESRNSSALAMELRLSCTNPSTCTLAEQLPPKTQCPGLSKDRTKYTPWQSTDDIHVIVFRLQQKFEWVQDFRFRW